MSAASDSVLKSLHEAHLLLWDGANDLNVSADARRAMRLELVEVNHRLMILIGKNISAQVKDLTDKASGIRAGVADLSRVLKNIQAAVEVVKAVTKFLRGVDSFIDAAKKYMT